MLIWTLLLLASAASSVAGDSMRDSSALPPDSATHRVTYSGIESYFAIDVEHDRAAWQRPDEVVDSLHIEPGQRVADIGAGIGYFESRLAAAVGPTGAVYAQEIQPDLVRYLEKRAWQEWTPQVHATLGTAEDSGLPDSLDLVFLCNTYRYIDGRRAYFARLRSHLKPTGRLAIVEFRRFAQDTTEHRILPSQVIAELRDAGYELVNEYDFLPKQYFYVFRPRGQ